MWVANVRAPTRHFCLLGTCAHTCRLVAPPHSSLFKVHLNSGTDTGLCAVRTSFGFTSWDCPPHFGAPAGSFPAHPADSAAPVSDSWGPFLLSAPRRFEMLPLPALVVRQKRWSGMWRNTGSEAAMSGAKRRSGKLKRKPVSVFNTVWCLQLGQRTSHFL